MLTGALTSFTILDKLGGMKTEIKNAVAARFGIGVAAANAAFPRFRIPETWSVIPRNNNAPRKSDA
jgi:hypothetical protein